MQLTTGYEDRRARIEIVPLIDVVFLLLVFFIYAMLSMTLQRGLKVDLPRGRGSVEGSANVVVSIASDSSVWIDQRRVAMDEAVRIAARKSAESGRAVLISGDGRAELGVAVELLSELRDARVSSVSFQVRQGP